VLLVAHDDEVLDQHFNTQGYRRRRGCVLLSRNLDKTIPPVQLGEGFVIRACMGEPEVAARASAQYGAFDSPAAFDPYLKRFTHFMRSPVYNPDLDIVAVAPDGRVGAFCIVWTDPINEVGLFEPVGAHPDFQRNGLGRAVMQEGLCRLQERGMKSAIVSTGENNLPAIKLNESVGFRLVKQLGTYEKDV
jgi:mycothiol synthase